MMPLKNKLMKNAINNVNNNVKNNVNNNANNNVIKNALNLFALNTEKNFKDDNWINNS